MISPNFSKYENLAKQKFLESLSSNYLKKKSTITNINFNNDNNTSNSNVNIKDNNNANFNSTEYLKIKSNLEESKNEQKDLFLNKENNVSYKKLNQVHSELNNEGETPLWEKAWKWTKEKLVEIKNNENFRTCINPFRNDSDPYARYCYYCMTITCCFIWFMLFYMALSTY